VGADAEAEEQGYEQEPALGGTEVGAVVPAEHGPEDDGSDEHGQAVDFALDSGEPGGVAEEVAEGAGGGGDEGYGFAPYGEQTDGPEEEHDGEPRRHGGEGIAAEGHMGRGGGKPAEDVGQQLVEGRSGGMAHLQEMGHGDKLAAVPKADGGFKGEEIDEGG